MAFYQVRNVYKRFDDTQVLRGIDFEMERGQVLAIIGSSGSGKTTLLRCLNFLEIPDSASIELEGETLVDIADSEADQSYERTGWYQRRLARIRALPEEQQAAALQKLQDGAERRRVRRIRQDAAAQNKIRSLRARQETTADKDRVQIARMPQERQARAERAAARRYRRFETRIADRKKRQDQTVRQRREKDFADVIRENRAYFGFVFQSFHLFPHYNVLDNVTLAADLRLKGRNRADEHAQIEARAIEILERVGLGDKLRAYPCELSGGQQQRVAIARALILDPKILCFDEPTSALDPELTREVLRVIRDLKRDGRTMIVVTHEMEFARRVADKVIFMADGVIEEQGAPDQIFDDPQRDKTKAFLQESERGLDD